ncbi:hypothetical protein HY629_03105 [Candidatus Uhrbacteria bacterium]|nr:hypothetical protein [Candidatus Uhrbacteria bacterium]
MNILSLHKWCVAFLVLAFLAGTLAGISLVKNVEEGPVSDFNNQEWRAGVSGKVVSVSDASLTISLREGVQQTFPITNETKVSASALNSESQRFDLTQEILSPKDITTGDEVGINLVRGLGSAPRVEQIYILRGI